MTMTPADHAVARLSERVLAGRGSGYFSEDHFEDVKTLVSHWSGLLTELEGYREFRDCEDRLIDALDATI